MLYMFYMVKKCKGGKVVGGSMENRRYRRFGVRLLLPSFPNGNIHG